MNPGNLRPQAPAPRKSSAFTLIELLVVVAIITILAVIVFTAAPAMIRRGQITASLSNMRQVGAGFQMYATDHDNDLPGRIRGDSNRWPSLLFEYLQDKKVYADPSDPKNFLLTHRDPLSNNRNFTSYIMNGYNDLGALNNQDVTVKINAIDRPSDTILLGNQSGTSHFYMDSEVGDQNSVLRKDAINGGSNYLFADGSVRFIKKTDYRDDLWLVRKDTQVN